MTSSNNHRSPKHAWPSAWDRIAPPPSEADAKILIASCRERFDVMQKKVAAIVQHQRRLMPALRQSYASGLDSRLWDNDIRVNALGEKSRTIRFVGYLFASNSNIRPAQETNIQMMDRLRFKRAEYRWHRESETQWFTLDSPSDDQVGYWDGATLKPVN